MSGDFSRFTYDPCNNYTQVLMQQGRVLLDSDWNEMQAILSHQNEMTIRDLVGQAAFPVDNPAFTPTLKGGLSFDGKNDFLFVKNHSLDFSEHRHFSIIAQVNLQATKNEQMIFSQWNRTPELELATGVNFGVSAGGKLLLQRSVISDDGIEVEILESDVSIPFNEEITLAATFDGFFIRLFINQQEVLSLGEARMGLCEKGLVSVGAWLDERVPLGALKGQITDLAIYSCALKPEDWSAQNFRHRRPGEVGLQAWWPFTEGEGQNARDISGRGNHAVLGAGLEECAPVWLKPSLTFSAGRVYLNGMMAEQHTAQTMALKKEKNGYFLAYVDMYQRLVSAVDDPNLLEPGLLGADTSARFQSELSLGLFPATGTLSSEEELETEWDAYQRRRARQGQIKVNSLPKRGSMRSTLYRVQVMQDADLEQGDDLKVVWSSDNSSLAYGVEHREANCLRVTGLERANRKIVAGSYFSLLDEDGNILHDEDKLLKVTELNLVEGLVTFSGDLPDKAKPAKLMHWQNQALVLKRDEKEKGETLTFNIDDRLAITFNAGSCYWDGDFWLIPTRTANDSIACALDTWLMPFEARALYQTVATFKAEESTVWMHKDCRKVFVSAVQMDQFLRRTGGVMTGPLVLENSLLAEGESQFNGDVVINGDLNPRIIGTAQLKDQSVTHHKLAQNLGLHLGQCVLSQNESAPPGFTKVGKIKGETEHTSWEISENTLPLEGPFAAHDIGNSALLLYGSGELFEINKKALRKTIRYAQKTPFPGEAVRQFASCVMGGKLYVAGGKKEDDKKSNEFWCYHLAEDRWELKAHLPHPTSHMAICGYGDRIFAMGGLETKLFGLLKHDPSCKLYSYDLKEDNWSRCENMPDDRFSGSAVAVNGKIHYIGGSDRELAGIFSETFCNSHFIYDPVKDSWIWGHDIPMARSRFGILELNEKIYCLGGRTGLGFTANVQVYNPETDYWEAEASLHMPRSHVEPILLDQVIYALGGKAHGRYVGMIEHQKAVSDFYVHRLESYLEEKSYRDV